MDPNACLEEALMCCRLTLATCNDENALRLVDLIHDLDGWLSRGGFPPTRWRSPVADDLFIERINPHDLPLEQRLHDIGDLAMFLGGSDDSWTGQLLRLVAKSDPEHLARLQDAFPVHVRAWREWQQLDDPYVGALTARMVGV